MVDELPGRTLSDIGRDCRRYVHRFRFTCLTGQLQGIELLDTSRKHMRRNIIYDDLREEIAPANEFPGARWQASQTSAATRLSVVAAFCAAGGLAFSFLGMNVLPGAEFLDALGLTKLPYHLGFHLTAGCGRPAPATDGSMIPPVRLSCGGLASQRP
ncbi:MAG: hypothetical protein WBE80_15220 [Methylocella sp.]